MSGLLPENGSSQDQNLALTGFFDPIVLDNCVVRTNLIGKIFEFKTLIQRSSLHMIFTSNVSIMRKLQIFQVLLANAVYLPEFLVQIHRVD